MQLELDRESRGIEIVRSHAQVDKDLFAIDELLDDETHGSKHGQTSVVEFLRLHLRKGRGVFGLQAERVKA